MEVSRLLRKIEFDWKRDKDQGFCVDFSFLPIVHNNRLVSHLHGRGDNRKGGNLCIDNTFILFVPRGVDLYQNDERGASKT